MSNWDRMVSFAPDERQLDRARIITAARHDPAHVSRVAAERGRALGCVQHAQASRGAGAHVEQATAVLHPIRNRSDHGRDRLFLRRNGRGHGAILFIEEPDHLQGRRVIDARRPRVERLRMPRVLQVEDPARVSLWFLHTSVRWPPLRN